MFGTRKSQMADPRRKYSVNLDSYGIAASRRVTTVSIHSISESCGTSAAESAMTTDTYSRVPLVTGQFMRSIGARVSSGSKWVCRRISVNGRTRFSGCCRATYCSKVDGESPGQCCNEGALVCTYARASRIERSMPYGGGKPDEKGVIRAVPGAV